ncbi:MAG: hypothetical protein ABIP97_09995 [Chthoniobacterales bacterium]
MTDLLHATLIWEMPWAGIIFLALAIFLIALHAWKLRHRGLSRSKIVLLSVLRLLPALLIALLLARPVKMVSHEEDMKRKVMILADRSASMGLKDGGQESRYRKMLEFTRSTLQPTLREKGYKFEWLLFDAATKNVEGAAVANTIPDGDKTDIGNAISTALNTSRYPPLALIALTDGAANQTDSNRGAVGALLSLKIPFIGVGFGSDTGEQTLNLLGVDAPFLAPPHSKFQISARIEATISHPLPPFNLILLRNGKFKDKRLVSGVSSSRYWAENFEITEDIEGVYKYDIVIEPPPVEHLILIKDRESAIVRVNKESELRVLYMQGALTWDFKFMGRALRNDPTVKVTGLSRTSEHSVFRQNVEVAGELLNGFPDEVKDLAAFRVVILSNLNPSLLTAKQQDAIARFCSDYGGGVLMIGGRETFDASWRGSKLEQMLPVRFDDDIGVRGLDEPFQFLLTPEALADPVFEIDEAAKNREIWQKLPAFDDYGRIAEVKPGAVTWALHSRDTGPNGKPRVLMAAQRYGEGEIAVLAVQNFWKWRLTKDGAVPHFDRFWQQFIRKLAESGRQNIQIEMMTHELQPGQNITFKVQKIADPAEEKEKPRRNYRLQILNSSGKLIQDREIELTSSQAVESAFVPESADSYNVRVVDDSNTSLASRILEVRNANLELQKPGRDMESLRQWAMISGGSAWPAEEVIRDPKAFAEKIYAQIEMTKSSRNQGEPIGLNPWLFLTVILSLCAEWALRKKWMLT